VRRIFDDLFDLLDFLDGAAVFGAAFGGGLVVGPARLAGELGVATIVKGGDDRAVVGAFAGGEQRDCRDRQRSDRERARETLRDAGAGEERGEPA
jgi:uncharacterized protein YjlB